MEMATIAIEPTKRLEIERLLTLNGIAVNALDEAVDYDWPDTTPEDHQAWLDSATADEIAGWVWELQPVRSSGFVTR